MDGPTTPSSAVPGPRGTEYRCVVATRQGGPEVLQVMTRKLRQPRPREVRVKVEACSVSALDVQARQGDSTYPPRFPFVPGYAVVGLVDAVGPDVTHVAPGDRVVAMTEKGGYAEFVHVRRHPMMPISAGLDAGEVVAVALNYLVAHQVLSRTVRAVATVADSLPGMRASRCSARARSRFRDRPVASGSSWASRCTGPTSPRSTRG